MWKRIKRYGEKSNYLLGAALAQSSVPDNGGEGDVQVTDFGILVNHAYTLLAVKEVGEAYSESKTRLLQLRNPWGMREWEGPWKDDGEEWRTAQGKKAMAELGVVFEEDGTFWIEWGDFQMHFNKIYVCRVLSYTSWDSDRNTFSGGFEMPGETPWYRYEYAHEWTADNAGGCFNFPEWRKNPQFEFTTAEETDAIFLLMQPDPRMTAAGAAAPTGERKGGDEGGPKYDKKIGMYLMRGHERMRRKVLYDSEEIEGDDVVDSTPFIAYREVQCNTMDEEDDKPLEPYKRYVLCPSSFKPGMLGEFRLVVYTARPLDSPPELLPRLRELVVSGAWSDKNAGGCRNYVTWRKNDQYLLQLAADARASVVMFRAPSAHADTETALFSNKKSKSRSKKKKSKDPNNFLIGFVVAETEAARAPRKKLTVTEEEVIDKTSYTNNMEVAREFIAGQLSDGRPDGRPDGTRHYVVVPTTYEPAKHGEYSVVVYTDDERATLKKMEPSGWHTQESKGEWTERSAGGSRNYPTWVRNPLFKLRASRTAHVQAFLRQPEVSADSELGYEGIGYYVTADDGDLSLEDVAVESGFRMRQEVSAPDGGFRLEGDADYLLIPMTYRRNVLVPFEIEIFADHPSIKLTKLSEYEANSRRIPSLRRTAHRTRAYAAPLAAAAPSVRPRRPAQRRSPPPVSARPPPSLSLSHVQPNRSRPVYH